MHKQIGLIHLDIYYIVYLNLLLTYLLLPMVKSAMQHQCPEHSVIAYCKSVLSSYFNAVMRGRGRRLLPPSSARPSLSLSHTQQWAAAASVARRVAGAAGACLLWAATATAACPTMLMCPTLNCCSSPPSKPSLEMGSSYSCIASSIICLSELTLDILHHGLIIGQNLFQIQ